MEQKLPIGTVVSMKKTRRIYFIASVHEWEADTFNQGKYLYLFKECDITAYASEFIVMTIPTTDENDHRDPKKRSPLLPLSRSKIFIVGSCNASEDIIKRIELFYLCYNNQVKRPLFKDDYEYDFYMSGGVSGLIDRAFSLIASADSVVVVPKDSNGTMGTGTLHELAFAKFLGKPVCIVDFWEGRDYDKDYDN